MKPTPTRPGAVDCAAFEGVDVGMGAYLAEFSSKIDRADFVRRVVCDGINTRRGTLKFESGRRNPLQGANSGSVPWFSWLIASGALPDMLPTSLLCRMLSALR
ncbi:MAG: hypothetical protein ABIQ70_13930 [Dokdonella sp.]